MITWCRSLLEAELGHALEVAGVLDEIDSRYRLLDLIDLAGCHGMLGGESYVAADDIRTFGNDTLHVAPGLCDARRTLMNLATVLSAVGEF